MSDAMRRFWRGIAMWTAFSLAMYAVFLASPERVPIGAWIAIVVFTIAMFAGYPPSGERDPQ